MAFIDTELTHEAVHDTSNANTRYFRPAASAYCPVCEKPVELLGYSDAADTFNTDADDIELLVENGELHRVHNKRGNILICSDSLFRCFDERQTRRLDQSFRRLKPKS